MAALCSLFSVCLLNAQVFERERRLHRQKQARLSSSPRPPTPTPDPNPNSDPNPNPNPYQALLELASTLSTKLELLPLVRAVRSAACDVMSAERCTLYLVDQASSEYTLYLHCHPPPSPSPSPLTAHRSPLTFHHSTSTR